ncbi:hypothetical protein T4B_626 [Trichinella pseudospiralis]|uniref:Uncharacterized protein n=1 Tax=Trichinella pseudospiralis TaxID=6337 RepID=A0A0V1JN95_TRIPS|nr:hypothetical protein T4B_626 [Trichinella pseudospiralis]KRZ36448.1 hypothetical protein T4C_2335 [Trichinella pseudospiralis]
MRSRSFAEFSKSDKFRVILSSSILPFTGSDTVLVMQCKTTFCMHYDIITLFLSYCSLVENHCYQSVPKC